MYFEVECIAERRKHNKIFSEINWKNNGTRRRKAARNRNPCTFASLFPKAVRNTWKQWEKMINRMLQEPLLATSKSLVHPVLSWKSDILK